MKKYIYSITIEVVADDEEEADGTAQEIADRLHMGHIIPIPLRSEEL